MSSGRDDTFIAHVLDQLCELGTARAWPMFGGHGIYLHGVMFGLVAAETLYLKTDAGNRAAFEAAGAQPFIYDSNGRRVTMSYHEVPADAMDDGEALLPLARSAYAAAQRAKAAGQKRGRSRRPAPGKEG
jgi:DNA transformation protein and related proteins